MTAMLNCKDSLVGAAEDFLSLAKAFDGSQSARIVLMKQADNLRILSEDGFGTLMRQIEVSVLTGALNVLSSTGALHALPAKGTASSEALSTAAGVDQNVVQRAMRIAAAQGIAEESLSRTFGATTKNQAFAMEQLPRYLKTHAIDDIRDLSKSPYAFAHYMEGKSYYEVISADPERIEMFNKALAAMNDQMPVLGMFPFSSLKEQVEAEPKRPFIVDIGGGLGRPLISILGEAPAGFGARSVLQDRADVINAIPPETVPHVTLMIHDFFTPQPVKNAHIYLLRRVLHDFYDPVCIDIVRNIASAMGPSSRLLIGDFVVPKKVQVGNDFMVYWLDFAVMMLTGQEKTAQQFERILDASGLELVNIWSSSFGAQAIVEAKLKTS